MSFARSELAEENTAHELPECSLELVEIQDQKEDDVNEYERYKLGKQ